MRFSRIAYIASIAGLVGAIASVAHAKSSLGLGNNEPGAGPSVFVMHYMPWFAPVVNFIAAEQQQFYQALTHALEGMRHDPLQLWWLVGISFLYGIFHAAGPGHGKAVISSYMIANETELRRGVVISFLSAFVQGLMAILVTGAGFLILRGTTFNMTDASRWLEVMSFAVITGFGLWLLYRKFRGMLPMSLFGGSPSLALAGGGHMHVEHDHHDNDHHGHNHDHAHAHAHAPALARHDHNHGHHDHAGHDHHGHSHGAMEVCEVCGHSHAPTPDLVSGEKFSLTDAWTAIMAVGLRPCSGAIFVLTFSFLNGLYLGGIVSVLMMSVGTAITVSALATLAVTAKDAALKFAGDGAMSMRLANAIEITGAVIITLFGLTFLLASLQG
jgi:ABC-type nickel/cobalt efflux system permease component RcnA